jgi:hypothetical protein
VRTSGYAEGFLEYDGRDYEKDIAASDDAAFEEKVCT